MPPRCALLDLGWFIVPGIHPWLRQSTARTWCEHPAPERVRIRKNRRGHGELVPVHAARCPLRALEGDAPLLQAVEHSRPLGSGADWQGSP